MPFKQGGGFSNVNARIKNFTENVIPDRIERGLFILGLELGANADAYVPVETSALINSRSQQVTQTGPLFRLTIGYYQEYASALHSPNPGGRMDGWQPRPVPSPGKLTGGYNPNARQGWLNIAWNENQTQLLTDLAKDITQ